jgi:hypothetical protein
MMYAIVWWLPIAAMVGSVIFFAAWTWFHFPNRTANDVVDFLQHIDLEKVEDLLDPHTEYKYRSAMSSRDFRRLQRKRVHLYLEFLKRMSHNAGVLVDLGNKEAEHCNSEVADAARAVQQEAVAVRLYVFSTMVKLRFWLLIRLDSWFVLPALSLCDARETFGIHGIESYDRLKTAASALFLELHSNRFEELLQAL